MDEHSARLLSEALARHDTVRSRSGSRRRKQDPLRADRPVKGPTVDAVLGGASEVKAAPEDSLDQESDLDDLELDVLGDADVRGAIEVDVVDTEPVRWRENSPGVNRSEPSPPPSQGGSWTSKALLLVGALFVGVAAGLVVWNLVFSASDQVNPEVASAVEEAPEPTNVDSSIESEAADSSETSAIEEAQSTESDSLQPIETPEVVFELEANFEMTVYDVGPAISGVRSFAILVRHDDASETISTDRFTVEVVAADGADTVAIVRFEQPDVPPGSSAIASVRTESASSGPFEVVLVLDGNEVARGVLGPDAT